MASNKNAVPVTSKLGRMINFGMFGLVSSPKRRTGIVQRRFGSAPVSIGSGKRVDYFKGGPLPIEALPGRTEIERRGKYARVCKIVDMQSSNGETSARKICGDWVRLG